MSTFLIRTALSRFSLMAAKQSSTKATTASILSDGEREMIDRVHSHFPNSEPTKFHFFYETASPFSNFHPCSFEADGHTFDCSEKYMMYHKASKQLTRSSCSKSRLRPRLKNYSVTRKRQKPSFGRERLPIANRWDER